MAGQWKLTEIGVADNAGRMRMYTLNSTNTYTSRDPRTGTIYGADTSTLTPIAVTCSTT